MNKDQKQKLLIIGISLAILLIGIIGIVIGARRNAANSDDTASTELEIVTQTTEATTATTEATTEAASIESNNLTEAVTEEPTTEPSTKDSGDTTEAADKSDEEISDVVGTDEDTTPGMVIFVPEDGDASIPEAGGVSSEGPTAVMTDDTPGSVTTNPGDDTSKDAETSSDNSNSTNGSDSPSGGSTANSPNNSGGVSSDASGTEYVNYYFRNSTRLKEHFEKHGKEMGFASAEEYEKAASDVVNNPLALHKTEAEDGDDVYYIEETNEFVIVSPDGYLRTYFNPNDGINYYNRQ